jgi:hypothetical protein
LPNQLLLTATFVAKARVKRLDNLMMMGVQVIVVNKLV